MLSQGSSSAKDTLLKAGLMPQEEMLEVGHKNKKLVIGIPKESNKYEYRVPLTPEAIEILVSLGNEVYIEKNAGINANYTDLRYSESGAIVTDNKADIFKADIILKVSPLTLDEIKYLNERQVVISSLLLNSQNTEYFKNLMDKKATAIAYEFVKDEYGSFPVEQSMRAIAGNIAIIIAGEYLSKAHNGKGVLLGGIPGITPTEVIILGAGTAAEHAIRAALGFGAEVKVFDNSVQKLHTLEKAVGRSLHTSIFHPKILKKVLKSADVVIDSLSMGETEGYYITEDMVCEMKPGSIIVDISVDVGGAIETSECRSQENPVYTKHGVLHYCVPNIPSQVSRTASIALSNVLNPMLRNMAALGGLKQQLLENKGIRSGVYMYNGILTNHRIGELFDLPSKDIDLLMAAF